jgi:hypothetical protein
MHGMGYASLARETASNRTGRIVAWLRSCVDGTHLTRGGWPLRRWFGSAYGLPPAS